MRRLKLMGWTMTLSALLLTSGCATVKSGSYCAAAQTPFQWRSGAEIDQTPIRVLRYVETDAITWEKLCGK